MPRRACRTPAAPILRAVLAGLLLGSPAGALTLPMSGWSPVNPTQQEGGPQPGSQTGSQPSSQPGPRAQLWTDVASACTLREDRSAQPYSDFADRDAALTFAGRLQTALQAQKLGAVVTQPVERAGRWTVLAAYRFTQSGIDYDVTQLYLSEGGRLRTITGSSARAEASDCVAQMREFVRYLAN